MKIHVSENVVKAQQTSLDIDSAEAFHRVKELLPHLGSDHLARLLADVSAAVKSSMKPR